MNDPLIQILRLSASFRQKEAFGSEQSWTQFSLGLAAMQPFLNENSHLNAVFTTN